MKKKIIFGTLIAAVIAIVSFYAGSYNTYSNLAAWEREAYDSSISTFKQLAIEEHTGLEYEYLSYVFYPRTCVWRKGIVLFNPEQVHPMIVSGGAQYGKSSYKQMVIEKRARDEHHKLFLAVCHHKDSVEKALNRTLFQLQVQEYQKETALLQQEVAFTQKEFAMTKELMDLAEDKQQCDIESKMLLVKESKTSNKILDLLNYIYKEKPYLVVEDSILKQKCYAFTEN